MPKIPEEKRQERRRQILEAAWRCFYRNGVQSTTIEDIIKESGLAASAMYRYFGGKDDIILTAIATSLGAVTKELAPLFSAESRLAPREFLGTALDSIERFARREGFNLLPIAVHGWSLAQSDEQVRTLMQGYYQQLRSRLADRVVRWQREGSIARDADPMEVTKALHSIVLGYIVQSTLMRDIDGESQARGVMALAGARR